MKSSSIDSIPAQNSGYPAMINFNLSVSGWKVTRFLLFVVGSLVVLSLLGNFATYYLPDFPMRDLFADKFALNEEQNFPTLYSALALFLISMLLWVIARFKSEVSDHYTLYWKALSAIFVYLSLDELLSIHEAFSKPMHNLGINGILHNAWVVPGFVVLGIFIVSFSRFFFHLPPVLKRSIVFAILLFVGGAFIVEIVGGYYKYLYSEHNLGYDLITTVEESMEMLGVVVFIHGLLVYIHQIGINRINLGLNVGRQL